MEEKGFTLEEAVEIADDFEDLIDTEFNTDRTTTYFIENVLVAPFPPDAQKQFADEYHKSRDKESALSFYTGSEYDVLVMTCNVNDESVLIPVDIRTFALERGIKYSFPS